MSRTTKAFILDDEEQGRKIIRMFLKTRFPEIEVEEAASIDDAIPILRKQTPDIIFLDVHLKAGIGFDLFNRLDLSNTGIIFVTAHNEYAIKAFKYSAIDYLLKPVDIDEFESAVRKALNSRELKTTYQQISFLQQNLQNKSTPPTKLTIPTSDGFILIPIHEIIYCRANSNYTELYISGNQRVMSSYNLGYYQDILSEHHFFRIHRSFLINIAQVKKYKKGDGGSVIMNNDEELEVARNNKETFLGLFKS